MLWSDREPQQASGSLRQALSNVRKALGPQADRLGADRTTLWLHPEVTLDTTAAGEFLADLDIRDPGFSDWLRDQRGRHDDPPEVQPRHRPAARHGTAAARRVAAVVMLRWTDMGVTPRGRFLTHALAQADCRRPA